MKRKCERIDKFSFFGKNDELTPCHFFKKGAVFQFPIFVLTSFFGLNGSHNKSAWLLGLSWRVNGEDWKFSFFGKNDELTPCHFFQKGRFSKLSQKCLYFHFWMSKRVSHNKFFECGNVGTIMEEKTKRIERITNFQFFFGKNDELTPCHFLQFQKRSLFWHYKSFGTIME